MLVPPTPPPMMTARACSAILARRSPRAPTASYRVAAAIPSRGATRPIEQVIAAIPDWAGRSVTSERIAGRADERELPGRGRRRRRCSCGSRAPTRSCSRSTAANELLNTRAAAQAGVAPRVVHDRPRVGRLRARVARRRGRCRTRRSGAPGCPSASRAVLRQLHAGPRFRDDFDMFRLSPSATSRSSTSAASRSRPAIATTSASSRGSRRPSPSIRSPTRPVPQRPARRELPRRRRAPVDRRLRVQRQ